MAKGAEIHGNRYTEEQRAALIRLAGCHHGETMQRKHAAVAAAVTAGSVPGVTEVPGVVTLYRWMKKGAPAQDQSTGSGVRDLAETGEEKQARLEDAEPTKCHVGEIACHETMVGELALLSLDELGSRLNRVATQLMSHNLLVGRELNTYKRLNKALGKTRDGKVLAKPEQSIRHWAGVIMARWQVILAEGVATQSSAVPGATNEKVPVGSEAKSLVAASTVIAAAVEPFAQTRLPDARPTDIYDDPRGAEHPSSGWGQLAASASAGLRHGTIVKAPGFGIADDQAQFRVLIVAFARERGLTTEKVAEQVRDAFQSRVHPLRPILDSLPTEAIKKFKSLTGRTIRRWLDQADAATTSAEAGGLKAPPIIEVLRHKSPVKVSKPTKMTPEVISHLITLAAAPENQDWNARHFKDFLGVHLQVEVSQQTIRRTLNTYLSDVERIRAKGEDAIDLVYRKKLAREAPYANRVWIMDHSYLSHDTLVPEGNAEACKDFDFGIDFMDDSGKKLRRADRLYVTAIKDAYSRRTVALRIWSNPPGTKECLLALYDAIRLYGVPEVLYSDNGADLTSKEFTAFLRSAGIVQVRTAPYTPQGRAKIERWFGFLKHQLIVGLPGYREGDHRRAWRDEDLLPLSQLRSMIQKAVDLEEQSVIHKTTGRVPAEHYEESLGIRLGTGSWGKLECALFLLPSEQLKLSRDGVRFKGQTYYCSELSVLPTGQTILVRYDPANRDVIYVFAWAGNGKMMYVGAAEYMDSTHPGPSFVQQQAAEAKIKAIYEEQLRQNAMQREHLLRASAARAQAEGLVHVLTPPAPSPAISAPPPALLGPGPASHQEDMAIILASDAVSSGHDGDGVEEPVRPEMAPPEAPKAKQKRQSAGARRTAHRCLAPSTQANASAGKSNGCVPSKSVPIRVWED